MSTTPNQEIALSEAISLTTAFRSANPGANRAQVYYKPIIEKILNQPGCVGIREYNGLTGSGTSSIQSNVLVGIDENGNDMVDGVLGDRSIKSVGNANVLNS